jgi:hypothetical protein
MNNALLALTLGTLLVAGAHRAAGDVATAPHAPAAALRCTPQTASRLYFGFDTPEGPLSETRRQAFVESEVAPRLPAGFTVWTARGQWRSSDGATRQEDSRVLEVVGADDAAQRHRLAEIVGRYEARFRQESVLVTQASARACW